MSEVYVISKPTVAYSTVEDVKHYVITENSNDLLRELLYGKPVKDIIGNPNEAFTNDVCDMLAELSILTKTPWCQSGGKQITIKMQDKEIPLFNYSWGEVDFNRCSEEQLNQVAWDLRYHGAFTHVWAVDPVDDLKTEREDESTTEETYQSKSFDSEATFFCAISSPWPRKQVHRDKKVKLSLKKETLEWVGKDD